MHLKRLVLSVPLVLPVALTLAGCPGVNSSQPRPVTPTSTAPTGRPAATASPETAPTETPKMVPPPQKRAEVEGVVEYALANGMRVLLLEDASQANLTVNVSYFVGSRQEGYGESGMAHLLEHMIFKGTDRFPDILPLMEKRGALYGASTSTDITTYYDILAPEGDNLAFVLEMEADRMVNCHIAAEDLAAEFSVVRNEFERNENLSWRVLLERMQSTAYLWHNYGKATIGSKSDIERVPASSLRAFYKKYYRPDNAMVVISGRFDSKQALSLVNQHFGAIPRPASPLPPTYTVEPVQDGERTVVMRRAGEVGLVGVLYHTVAGAAPEFVAFEALIDMLTAEPSGQLYQVLVKTGMANKVWSYAPPRREPSFALIMAEVAPGKPLEPVRDRMLTIVEGIGDARGKSALNQDQLVRHQRAARKNLQMYLNDSRLSALGLSEAAAIGDWRLMFLRRDRTDALTLDAIKRVARSHFLRSNRTVGLFRPTDKPARATPSERPDIAAMTRDYKGRAKLAAGEVFDANIANVKARMKTLTLASGMRVALLPKETRGDAVQVILGVQAGSEKAFAGKRAAESLIAPMLMRGTRQRSHQALRDEFDRLQARVFLSGSDRESAPGLATMVASTTREHLLPVLELMAEVVARPRFDAAEFRIVRDERIAALAEAKGEPRSAAERLAWQHLTQARKGELLHVPSHEEEIAELRRVKLADIRRLHKTLWGGQDSLMVLVGDFDAAAAEKTLTEHFGTWRSSRRYQRIPTPYRATPAHSAVIATPDKKNAFILVGQSVQLRNDDPDHAALTLAMHMFAEMRSSRLWSRLRSEEGLSYRVYGEFVADAFERNGYFYTSAICAPANVEKAMNIMQEEWRRLAEKGITEAELEVARSGWLKSAQATRAIDLGLASRIYQAMYGQRTMDYYQTLEQRIGSLTVEQVNRALARHLDPARLLHVRAGDL